MSLFLFTAYAQSIKVKIETSKGTMVAVLYDETPIHRDNFVKLAESGFYEGLLFHRVINTFMIQGGDPESKNAPLTKQLGNGGPGYTLPAEIIPKYYHKKGALAAARTGDQMNPQRRSSGSQFYIVHGKKFTDMQLDSMEKQMNTKFTKEQRDTYVEIGGAPHLDAQYTVFGEIIEGYDVIDKIAGVETNDKDRPVEDVKIIKITVVE
ncbi:MAG TPA: peptidylprolyl isomerase [Bacteroidales bacterium]|nr:peptidylprolyl isomerase [Bacteroidales bacterium]HOL98945.1 peptidylprolyl isomerase [Bacteroidales bacterium]HOM37212.1 peptidylprolyl isomerase [Bacteroidales bacterium]HPD24177.1 peptidylprolyl isomerase [Bacteroidales bacterium]HRS99861.1 peptidylprolyl isomerase [Bacteroidales bacterium]